MSEIKVNKISPATSTDITLGDSGDTFTVPSGATILNSGTATGFGGGGKLIKWYQYTETDQFTTAAGAGGIADDIIMTSSTITPASDTSGFFVMFHLAGSGGGDGPGLVIQYSVDDGVSWTDFTPVGTGATSGTTRSASHGAFGFKAHDNDNVQEFIAQGYQVAGIDTANFKVRGGTRGDCTAYFNRTVADLSSQWGYRGVLFMNIWEVATGVATQTAL